MCSRELRKLKEDGGGGSENGGAYAVATKGLGGMGRVENESRSMKASEEYKGDDDFIIG